MQFCAHNRELSSLVVGLTRLQHAGIMNRGNISCKFVRLAQSSRIAGAVALGLSIAGATSFDPTPALADAMAPSAKLKLVTKLQLETDEAAKQPSLAKRLKNSKTSSRSSRLTIAMAADNSQRLTQGNSILGIRRRLGQA